MAGIPFSSLGVWKGDLTMPHFGGAGYATMKYDIWSSRFGTSARYSNLVAVETEAVTGTLTFEDGTTFTRSLRAGFENITLPAGADVNGPRSAFTRRSRRDSTWGSTRLATSPEQAQYGSMPAGHSMTSPERKRPWTSVRTPPYSESL
jgi:hypothetical protein